MILQIENVTFSYGKNEVLKETAMEIIDPGIYGLVGPNGSGKTTLLNLIMGLLPTDKGNISVFGSEAISTKEVGFVQDNSVLYPYLSGKDHLEFICEQHSISKEGIQDMAELLDMTNYLKDKTKTYSLGMKQRLLLSMALIKQPKLLLLDEPLNGLDPTSTILMRETLMKTAEEGATVLVSSHNLSEMDQITNQLFFIKDKKIIWEKLDLKTSEQLIVEVTREDFQNAEIILREKEIDFVSESPRLIFSLSDIQIKEVIKVLATQGIGIERTETKRVGSESRYRSLYEAEFVHEK